MSRVIVLGAGFDSLLAAHAASVLGHDVRIYAAHTNVESMTGAQLLLAPIPMIPARCAPMRCSTKGDPADVIAKLLNQSGMGRGPEGLDRSDLDGAMVWDASDTYQWLRTTYIDHVVLLPDGTKPSNAVRDLVDPMAPDFIFSGMDSRSFCHEPLEHMFSISTTVNMAPPNQHESGYNYLEFSGDPDDSWAIESHLLGQSWRTYGAHNHPPVSAHKLFRADIPQLSNCTCYSAKENLHFVGKMATWNNRWPRHRSFYLPFHIMDRA